MIDEKTDSIGQHGAIGALVVCLYILAGISVAAGITLAASWFLRTPQATEASFHWIRAMNFLLEGLVLGSLLWAAGWLIRRRDESSMMQRRILRLLTDRLNNPIDPPIQQNAPSSSTSSEDSDTLQEILLQLSELNINVLLSDEKREAKRLCRAAELLDQRFQQVEQALSKDAFDQAEEILQELNREVPDDPRLEELNTQIQQGREAFIRRLLQGQVQRAKDLMSVSRFDEAMNLAENLHQQYPESPEADDLLSRVRRKAGTFQSEQRRRLLAIIQECGEARQWGSALAGAHRLLEIYGDSEEARNVRAMMPTLVDNARIEEVREYRDQIVKMVEQQQYTEALKMAEKVMGDYPETAAAEELRQQLPHLRELATQNPQNKP